MNYQSFKSCIEACHTCASQCEYCATECLKEDDIKMLSLCISLDRECALVCSSVAQLLSMGGENATLLCNVCVDICIACAIECEKNSAMEHCKRCAEYCRQCAEECKNMIEVEIA